MTVVGRLIDLVSDLVGRPQASETGSDPSLAVAALLVHVARVDGTFSASERSQILELLSRRFGLSETASARLVDRADRLDREVDDILDLIAMLGHSATLEDRRRLAVMAYEVAAADGRLAEFEDDLVWRMAEHLGFGPNEIKALRDEVRFSSEVDTKERT